ncbi:MAG: DegT/DnrJ/EryC1/StrS family aminotransferase [Anaerolineae bacterium]|nr:DegT/DnrJ/EryC1/StrS family aminotransferase [Anaerolineae bacterium]
MYIIGKEEVEAVEKVINSKQLFRYRGGEGGESEQFEAEWSKKIGVDYTVAVTSGTAALICGLVGMGIGPGDEVIVPAYTFMATALAALAVGAVPILAEVDSSLTIDPVDIRRKITPRTKVIIPVHMVGLPCDMDAIMSIAKQHNIFVLEDACQADGGSYGGKRLGSIGDAGAFSFNHFKIMTCGEGGALVTNNREIYERALIFHDGGCSFRDHADTIRTPFFAGWNFRINEILSAILRVQLTRLDGMLDALLKEKRILIQELAGAGPFTFNPIHDIEGDCGTTVALLLDSEDKMRAFMENLSDVGVHASSPIDSGRHVYTNWEPVLEQQGSHNPAFNAYALTERPTEYHKDMCPTTLDVLARTLFLYTNPERSETELYEMISKIKQAAAKL